MHKIKISCSIERCSFGILPVELGRQCCRMMPKKKKDHVAWLSTPLNRTARRASANKAVFVLAFDRHPMRARFSAELNDIGHQNCLLPISSSSKLHVMESSCFQAVRIDGLNASCATLLADLVKGRRRASLAPETQSWLYDNGGIFTQSSSSVSSILREFG